MDFAKRWIDILAPRLAGSTLKDRVAAGLGALFGLSIAALLSRWWAGASDGLFLIGPMGATSVLLFAVPASPMAQPWPVIGGNVISALVGLAVMQLMPPGALSAGVAVAGAIVVMSLLRCLHPPGGATALTVVLLAAAGKAPDWDFALAPVGLDAVLMVATALAFHLISHHSYPHVPTPVVAARLFEPQDLDAALAAEHESFDIERADLERLIQRVEDAARQRKREAASRRSKTLKP